jgi:hypothetical protein
LLLGLGLSSIYLCRSNRGSLCRTDQWFGGRFAFGDDFVMFSTLLTRWGFGASIGPNDETGFQRLAA